MQSHRALTLAGIMRTFRHQYARAKAGAVLLILALSATAPLANPARSPAVRAEFMRTHPCPANGNTRGACPGYQVDHIQPLKCGGPDTAANMQWLTVKAHKEKTAREAKSCRHRRGQAQS